MYLYTCLWFKPMTNQTYKLYEMPKTLWWWNCFKLRHNWTMTTMKTILKRFSSQLKWKKIPVIHMSFVHSLKMLVPHITLFLNMSVNVCVCVFPNRRSKHKMIVSPGFTHSSHRFFAYLFLCSLSTVKNFFFPVLRVFPQIVWLTNWWYLPGQAGQPADMDCCTHPSEWGT